MPNYAVKVAMTGEEVVSLLQGANPSPLRCSCELRLDSGFYDELDALADKEGVKQVGEDE